MMLCVLNKEFGTLVLIIKKMTRDILNFGLLWLLFLFGFIFAEYYIARGIESAITSAGLKFFILSAGGDPDFSAWEEVQIDFSIQLLHLYIYVLCRRTLK